MLARLASAAQPEPSHPHIGSGAVTAPTATLILAGMTFLLAAAAVGTIVVTLVTRDRERREREQLAFRAAIIEQVEECRAWVSASPGSSNSADIGLIERDGHFGAVERLIGSVPLDLPCFSRLLARLAKVRDWNYSKWAASKRVGPHGDFAGDWGSEWHSQVTQRQEVVGLLLGAASDRGHHELVTALRGHSALRPIPWKPSRVETEVGEVTHAGMLPYPEGAAYQPWSPSAQDAWADKISAATSQHFNAALRQGRGL